MPEPRDWQKYEVRVGRKKVHGGITSRSLDEREAEHQQKWLGAKITKVGRSTTEEGARKWEREKGYS